MFNINDLSNDTDINKIKYSSQCISNNNFNGIIYKKINIFDKYFCNTIESILSSFKMIYQNKYKSLNIKISNINTKLHYYHIIDNETDILNNKIKKYISNNSTYFILEYSTYSKHKYIIEYVNKKYNYGNITHILEKYLLQNKRIYTLSHKYNKYIDKYYLKINKNLIFSMLIGFMLYVYKPKFFNKYNLLKYNKLIFKYDNKSLYIKPLLITDNLSFIIKYFYNYNTNYLCELINIDKYYYNNFLQNIFNVLNGFII